MSKDSINTIPSHEFFYLFSGICMAFILLAQQSTLLVLVEILDIVPYMSEVGKRPDGAVVSPTAFTAVDRASSVESVGESVIVFLNKFSRNA